jgi:flagellar basal body-associated protein FliL
MHKEQEDGEVVTHVTDTEARSGSRTRVTRNILVISLVLVIAVLAITMGFGFFETGESGADQVNGNMTQQGAG